MYRFLFFVACRNYSSIHNHFNFKAQSYSRFSNKVLILIFIKTLIFAVIFCLYGLQFRW